MEFNNKMRFEYCQTVVLNTSPPLLLKKQKKTLIVSSSLSFLWLDKNHFKSQNRVSHWNAFYPCCLELKLEICCVLCPCLNIIECLFTWLLISLGFHNSEESFTFRALIKRDLMGANDWTLAFISLA